MTESSKIDVVGVGLNATDTLIPVAHYPARGSKVEFRSANVLPGGQVATTVVACQQWGLRTHYVGKLGDDGAAAMHRAEFARLGVEAHLFTAPGCPSQQAFILVDDAGERTLEMAVRKMGLSARAHDRILKVARTIADLDHSDNVSAKHLAEAVQYRSLDRNYWT